MMYLQVTLQTANTSRWLCLVYKQIGAQNKLRKINKRSKYSVSMVRIAYGLNPEARRGERPSTDTIYAGFNSGSPPPAVEL